MVFTQEVFIFSRKIYTTTFLCKIDVEVRALLFELESKIMTISISDGYKNCLVQVESYYECIFGTIS